MTTVPSARRASGQILIVLLGVLAMLGPFSNDTVLPNFPHIESHFGIGDVRMQQTLTLQVYESALTLALCSLVMGLLGFTCWLGFLARRALHLRGARA